MTDDYDTLCYHGRRSVDELVVALNADTVTAALVHKQLSMLHLDRFVSIVTATADGIDHDR